VKMNTTARVKRNVGQHFARVVGAPICHITKCTRRGAATGVNIVPLRQAMGRMGNHLGGIGCGVVVRKNDLVMQIGVRFLYNTLIGEYETAIGQSSFCCGNN